MSRVTPGIFFERRQHLRVAVPADVAIGQDLRLGRHLVAICPGPEQRRRADHLDWGAGSKGRFGGLLRRRRGGKQDIAKPSAGKTHLRSGIA